MWSELKDKLLPSDVCGLVTVEHTSGEITDLSHCRDLDNYLSFEAGLMTFGGRNSSVGSAWARCPQRRGFDPPLGTFSVEGIFPLELTWVQTPFPQKLLRMRV